MIGETALEGGPEENPLRILILGLNYSPEYVGVGRYTGELARWLATRGHQVQVICAPPYYPQWKVWHGYRSWRFRREVDQQVEVLRCPIWVPRQPRPLFRIVHLMSFALSSLIGLIRRWRYRPHWVLTVVPTLAAVPGGLVYAKLLGARTWLHVQDFELGAAAALDMSASRRVWSVLKRTENLMLRRFDRVSTISASMSEQLAATGVPAERICYLPNWVDSSLIRPDATNEQVWAQLRRSPDECIALYAGTINVKQHLEMVVDSARVLAAEKGLHFVICGDGPAKADLVRRATGLPNLSWLPPQDEKDLAALLAGADFHLLPQRAGVGTQVLPSKLAGMLASGRPVVAEAESDSDVARMVSGCGLVTPPADLEQFVQAIRRMHEDRQFRGECGRNARQIAETDLDREKVLSAMEAWLQ